MFCANFSAFSPSGTSIMMTCRSSASNHDGEHHHSLVYSRLCGEARQHCPNLTCKGGGQHHALDCALIFCHRRQQVLCAFHSRCHEKLLRVFRRSVAEWRGTMEDVFGATNSSVKSACKRAEILMKWFGDQISICKRLCAFFLWQTSCKHMSDLCGLQRWSESR